MPSVKAVALYKAPFANYTKKTLRSSISALRRAVKVMNDGGTHWMQGEYDGVNEIDTSDGGFEEVQAYCAMGGVNQSVGRTRGGVYEVCTLALALAANKAKVTDKLKQLTADLAAWQFEQNNVWGLWPAPSLEVYSESGGYIEEIVTAYNDTAGRTWRQIVKLFAKAEALITKEIDSRD